ncbi:MAG: hypothetical protein U0324_10440 [Polyangiales bacterium]
MPSDEDPIDPVFDPTGATRFDVRERLGEAPEGGDAAVDALAFSRDGRRLYVAVGGALLEAGLATGRWRRTRRWLGQYDEDVAPGTVRVRDVLEVPRAGALAVHAIGDPPPGTMRTEFAVWLARSRDHATALRCTPDPERLPDLQALAVAPGAPRAAAIEFVGFGGGDPGAETRLVMLDGRTGQELEWFPPEGACAVALSPDGTRVALAGGDALTLFEPATGARRRVALSTRSRRTRMRFSPDGGRLFVATPSPAPSLLRSGRDFARAPARLAVVDAHAAAVAHVTELAGDGLYPVAVTPRGTCVFARMEARDAAFWGEDELAPARGEVRLTRVRPGAAATPARTWDVAPARAPATALAVSPGLRHVAWAAAGDVHVAPLTPARAR